MSEMLSELLGNDVETLIAQKRWSAFTRERIDWPEPENVAPELVDVLVGLRPTDQVLFFRSLPKDVAAEVFAYLDRDTRDRLLAKLASDETRHLLEDMSPDDRTALLEELPGKVTQRLLNYLSADDLAEARQLLGYPDESAGRLMTPDYVAVRPEWTIEHALSHIRQRGDDSETIDMIYVHDHEWHLLDALPLKAFILTRPKKTVSEIMDGSFVSISAYEDREEAVRTMQRYDLLALPVVDSDGVLLGIVTIDDALDVAEAEATEDFHLTAAVTPFKTGYWDTSAWTLYISRVGWLAALVLVSLVSSGVIAAYEEVLTREVALSFFIPLLIGAGGNAGSQSATMMIRAISTDEVKLRQWFRVFSREIFIGLILGTSLGLLGFALGLFRGGVDVGLVVAISMVAMLTITNLLGMSLPFLLIRLNLDPASASGPLVASVADAIGLLVYFQVAQWVFRFL
ncbi:MAG: magnesium transporter [Trueperaceae bacterium]|nr:magnesium transporter [Trueperaceae bacterium]